MRKKDNEDSSWVKKRGDWRKDEIWNSKFRLKEVKIDGMLNDKHPRRDQDLQKCISPNPRSDRVR
jgi:hypothetical protein